MADDIDSLLRLLVGKSHLGSQPQVVTEFADQFGADVTGITDEHRGALTAALGKATFPVVVTIYLADFLLRVKAGLDALGLPTDWFAGEESEDDATDVLFNRFLPAVARLRDLDPITTELVRLRGARAHDCRLCKSLRESTALDAGGSESLYGDIDRYESSALLSDAHKAALRYADALIWSPSRIDADVAADVLRHFAPAQARELTLDVMRNASNKIAVSLKADAARVAQGTERYLIDADGQTVYS